MDVFGIYLLQKSCTLINRFPASLLSEKANFPDKISSYFGTNAVTGWYHTSFESLFIDHYLKRVINVICKGEINIKSIFLHFLK